jgi:hypothetical protein
MKSSAVREVVAEVDHVIVSDSGVRIITREMIPHSLGDAAGAQVPVRQVEVSDTAKRFPDQGILPEDR